MADKKTIRNEASSSGSNHNNGRGESVVVDVGRRRSSCGYCKSGSHTSITHGLWAHSLTVDDYQALLDRGWRRSGCFLYKPEMEKTCCPSYTIRLKSTDFVPSKEQTRVAKRMQRFIDGALNAKKLDEHDEASEYNSSVETTVLVENGVQNNNLEQVTNYLSSQIDSVIQTCIDHGQLPPNIQFPKATVKIVAPTKRKLEAEGTQNLLYSSNISFQISAAIKRANKNSHFLQNPKSIADEITTNLTNLPFDLSVKSCNGHINFYSTETQSQPDIILEKPAISKDSSKKSSLNLSGKFQAKGPNLEIRIKRSTFDPEEYNLYKKYQITVHNDAPDHVTESSYKRFLVDSPLIFVPSKNDGLTPVCGFGSFHQQYLINGKLVAVGVMDILPKCLSSKYLFWDPDFAFLSLGKYSALQEINWVRENQGFCSSLEYYYLGYYIHSCNKMRYKAAYRPSELLCPLRYQWVPFDIAKRVLDKKAYAVLSDYATLENEESSSTSSVNVFEECKEDVFSEESNDIRVDNDKDDEEMSEVDFEDSDEEEIINLQSPKEMGKEEEDFSNIVVRLQGMHLRYKDIRDAFGGKERGYLEKQLQRYMRVVGKELSDRMVYSLG